MEKNGKKTANEPKDDGDPDKEQPSSEGMRCEDPMVQTQDAYLGERYGWYREYRPNVVSLYILLYAYSVEYKGIVPFQELAVMGWATLEDPIQMHLLMILENRSQPRTVLGRQSDHGERKGHTFTLVGEIISFLHIEFLWEGDGNDGGE
ncbi:MAG: hypothetical protein Q9195_009232 [Heterodermia aff. obscurata]